jgi:hypothetical protein
MSAVPLALVCILIASHAIVEQGGSGAGTVRLRPMQPMGRTLVAEGLKRSGTFRRLVRDLDRSDVIVYVDLRADMASHVVGSLRFVAPSATDRFLRISLNRHYDRSTLIAFLGHELQHANEVANAHDVRSADGLRAFYQRIGIRVGRNAYDSREAQAAGQIVRAELRGGPVPMLAERHVSLDRILLGSGSIEAFER